MNTLVTMKRLTLLAALPLLLSLMSMSAFAGDGTLKLKVSKTERTQGEFFIVEAEGAESEPTLFFMERKWQMFPDNEGGWTAMVPVENLSTPGSYAFLLRDGKRERHQKVRIRTNNLPIQNITLRGSKAGLHATETEKTKVRSALQTITAEKLNSGPLILPCKGEISSIFGRKRSYNGGPAASYHKGVDFGAPSGTPVLAPASGTVILAGTVEEGFVVHGNTVILNHGHALTSVYLHMSSITVREGDRVQRGEEIGRVGHTGISTAPHLHWGTYLYGISVDPLFLVTTSSPEGAP
ncbi:peptidoglycan DD-metalloendopeptidase family protein [Chlorobium phaeovibrioides]|uniref:Peptidoglycan DD-metalloendopeptidase family protein n=2 Tax=Chlorobium phaeovibrioides TaxID=1094 RepID=A0ABW9UPY0_CHLPH|nr:peptidoglycan DD-metalloendopeptidase family protein [Chlorobium phaeovibrioides]